MLDVGLSVEISSNNEEEMKKISDSGIKAIEISFGDVNKISEFDFKRAKALADKYAIRLWSYHLPFAPFELLDPSALSKEKRDFTFNTFADLIEKGSEIGIDKFVVHPSAEPIPEEERNERLRYSAEFFSRLAQKAESCGAVIAVEDLPRTCIGNSSSDIQYILNADERLRVCFDTNHLLNEKNIDFIKNVGSKIVTLHVSDYDFVNERHWLPGEGDNDWQAIYSALTDAGYNGVWLYELGLMPPKTINRRILTYTDYYNNAKEIMSGKKPTAIGKKIENLGFWSPN